LSFLNSAFSTTTTEFHNLDEKIMLKALDVLAKSGKAQIFSGSTATEQGVKFF